MEILPEHVLSGAKSSKLEMTKFSHYFTTISKINVIIEGKTANTLIKREISRILVLESKNHNN